MGQVAAVERATGCTVIAAIVNQLVRIVNKSLFYNSTIPQRATFVRNLLSVFVGKGRGFHFDFNASSPRDNYTKLF